MDHIVSRDDGLIYMWDNIMEDGISVLARLGGFYLFSNSEQNPSSYIVHYMTLGDSSFFFNHLPISFIIDLITSSIGGSYWKANARFHQEVTDPIKAI